MKMNLKKYNYLFLGLLFTVTILAAILDGGFWLHFFWALSMILFYGIYSQYSRDTKWSSELMFLFFFSGNVFAIFYESWYFSELTLLSFCGAYASLIAYLYKRKGANSIDSSFKPYFIGAFLINALLVVALLVILSKYFESSLLLPIFIIYFLLILSLIGLAFLHFNSVASLNSLFLLGFVLSIVLADLLRFIDQYYYSSVFVKICAVVIYSFGYLLAYARLTYLAKEKKESYMSISKSKPLKVKEE